MFLESFRHLIEIEALKKQNQVNAATIASENKRISDLEERRKKVLSHNEDLKIEEKNLKLLELQNQIEDFQLRLNKLTSQLEMATTLVQETAFKNQIHTVQTEVDSLEALFFSSLEKSETIQNQIKENNEFHQGSSKTLEEIKKEVAQAIIKEEIVISDRNKRIESLMSLCLPSFIKFYTDLEKNFAPKSPVSYLVDKKCTSCFMTTDSTLRTSLEEGRSLETCPNCSRLLIPETAKIY